MTSPHTRCDALAHRQLAADSSNRCQDSPSVCEKVPGDSGPCSRRASAGNLLHCSLTLLFSGELSHPRPRLLAYKMHLHCSHAMEGWCSSVSSPGPAPCLTRPCAVASFHSFAIHMFLYDELFLLSCFLFFWRQSQFAAQAGFKLTT